MGKANSIDLSPNMHEEVLNLILSRSCYNPANYPENDEQAYKITLCCDELIVIAKPIRDSKGDFTGKYEVISTREVAHS